MELLEAVVLGKNIVGPEWIIDGYRNGLIPDTLDYFMHDDENEKAFGYDLKYSILKARYRKVFQVIAQFFSFSFHFLFYFLLFLYFYFLFSLILPL